MRGQFIAVCVGMAMLALACANGDGGGSDAMIINTGDGQPPPVDAPPPGIEARPPVGDQGTTPQSDGSQVLPTGSIKAAAVQYGPGMYKNAPGCSDDNCGVKYFVIEAAKKGATHIAVPEAILGIETSPGYVLAEESPSIGDSPATDSRWGPQTVLGMFAKVADDYNVTVIIQLITCEGESTCYSTHVAIGPDGKVIGRHYKYYLYDGEESLTPGTNCCDLFDTPAGKAGLLICSDINCIPTMKIGGSNCTSLNYNKLLDFFKKKPHIAFISTFWMAWKSTSWQAINVFKKFAKLSGAYTVGANTIATFSPGCSGTCKGGGIFDPNGNTIDQYDSMTPGIAIGTIPKAGGPTPPPPPTGDVVVTELMANPKAVADGDGEWFEVYNKGTTTVDLSGWQISDNNSSHTIKSSVTVAPGKYVVLGNNDATSTNGGVPVAYEYSSFSLTNTGDQIKLHDANGNVVDEVEYLSSWGVTAGASLSLKDPSLDNKVGSNWCVETTTWAGSAGDKGSPGAAAKCK